MTQIIHSISYLVFMELRFYKLLLYFFVSDNDIELFIKFIELFIDKREPYGFLGKRGLGTTCDISHFVAVRVFYFIICACNPSFEDFEAGELSRSTVFLLFLEHIPADKVTFVRLDHKPHIRFDRSDV